jgi:hypothetical protein
MEDQASQNNQDVNAAINMFNLLLWKVDLLAKAAPISFQRESPE